MCQRHERRSQERQAEEIHIPAMVQVEDGQIVHGRPGEEHEICPISKEGAVDINHDSRQAQQDEQIPAIGFPAHIHLPGSNEVQRQPDQPRMVDEALIGPRIPEVHPVSGNEHSHDAAKQCRRDREADDLLLCGGGLCKGDIEDDKNLHGAQVERQRIGGQSHAAQRRGQQMGHHFEALAGNGNDGHHHSRGFDVNLTFFPKHQSQENSHSAEKKPEKMVDSKHVFPFPF